MAAELSYQSTTVVQLCDVLATRDEEEEGDAPLSVFPPLAETWLFVQEMQPSVGPPRLVRPPSGFRVHIGTGDSVATDSVGVQMARQLWNKYSYSPHPLALRARVAAFHNEAAAAATAATSETGATQAVAKWHQIYAGEMGGRRCGPPVNFVARVIVHAALHVVELEFPSFHAARFVAHWVRQYGKQKGLANLPACTLCTLMGGGARVVEWPRAASLDALLLAQLPTWTLGSQWICAPGPAVAEAGEALLLARPHVEFELHHLAREATMQDHLRRAMARVPSLWLRTEKWLPPTSGAIYQTITRIEQQVALKRARTDETSAPAAKKARTTAAVAVAPAPDLEEVRARLMQKGGKMNVSRDERNLGPHCRPVHDVSIRSFLQVRAPKQIPSPSPTETSPSSVAQ